MSRFFVICLLCFIALPAGARRPIDVVFDIDWTVASIVTAESQVHDPRGTVVIGEEVYRFADYAIEVLRKMHESGEYRVSFFSGGSEARNEELVRALYERINAGRTVFESFRPHAILGRTDLTRRPEVPDTERFARRFMKDLRKVPGLDVRWAIMADDYGTFAHPDQVRNMLPIEVTYIDRPVFEYAVAGDYQAPDRHSWRRERYRIVWAYEMIERARHRSEAQKVDMPTALMTEIADAGESPRNVNARAGVIIAQGFRRLGLAGLPNDRRAAPSCKAVWSP